MAISIARNQPGFPVWLPPHERADIQGGDQAVEWRCQTDSAAQSDSNVQMTTVPTGSHTTGNMTYYGNTAYGNFNTTYTSTPIIYGRNKAELHVLMLNPGDPGYDNGIDARQTLGSDSTCQTNSN